MNDQVYVVGGAWSNTPPDTDLQLDEAVFAVCYQALRNAGVRHHQVGMTITSSLDLYDARSISNALTAPAAGAYLGDEVRIEGDASSAVLHGMASLVAGVGEFVMVVGTHIPEVGSVAERDVRRHDEHVSSYTFDSHIDRPVALTSMVTLGMHASAALDSGALSIDDLAKQAAADINRGASAQRGQRSATTPEQVANADTAFAPLTSPMLPASSAGLGAIVLGIGVGARRCPNPLARVSGWGTATGRPSWDKAWLDEPGEPARRAAAHAYRMAGVSHPSDEVDFVEMTDLSPALTGPMLEALSLGAIDRDCVNISGGVRSNYPGIANGILRILEATDHIAAGRSRGVVHAADDLCGLVSATNNVLVLEAS